MSSSKGLRLLLGIAFLWISVIGCSSQSSYPSSQIKESVAAICRDEYGIKDVEIKIAGDTIGVYLPLQQLFAADFTESAITGKIRNLETLFEPSPEALEKVEDVLFAISRVLLSTDKEFKFYVLQATDVEKTGWQLVFTGHVDDIRRVRVWDIPRSEYRKRLVHELRMNRAVRWHQPVRAFLKDLGNLTIDQVREKYFQEALTNEAIQTIFFNQIPANDQANVKTKWNILDIRSTPVQKNEAFVYAKVQAEFLNNDSKKTTTGPELRFLFMVSFQQDPAQIKRIIPFQYQDESGTFRSIPLPGELKIDENLDKWEQEFPLVEVSVGEFLAEQITRRVQGLIAVDERIKNTFRKAEISFFYAEDPAPAHFGMNLEASLRDLNNYSRDSLITHEDMLYLLNLASLEFVSVVRSYKFGDYDFLSLNLAQEPSGWVLGREDLELFRRKKVDLRGLLTLP